MLLALRELKFARGRFALMGVVIALISVLVVLLSILSSGLVNDGVSGLEAMPATAFAFNEGTMTLTESFNACPGDEAETLTLELIQIFLYAICALVVGAFFTVWTIQRTRDIAVLRAMGASSSATATRASEPSTTSR